MAPLGLLPGWDVYVSVSLSTSSNQRRFHAVFFSPALSIQPPFTFSDGVFGLNSVAIRAASAADESMPIATDMRRLALCMAGGCAARRGVTGELPAAARPRPPVRSGGPTRCRRRALGRTSRTAPGSRVTPCLMLAASQPQW